MAKSIVRAIVFGAGFGVLAAGVTGMVIVGVVLGSLVFVVWLDPFPQ